MIKPGSTVLFQGDSISDINRSGDLKDVNHNRVLGIGFCNYIAARLLRERPADRLKFYNKSIGGNRIVDLYARWKIDAINLNPDVISILIGINDTWHRFSKQNGVDPRRFEAVYRMLLEDTKEHLPKVRLILGEPFAFRCGVVTEEWIEELVQRQQIVKKLAGEFGAIFVPFQSALDKVLEDAPPEYWVGDGVHPTLAGHWVLSECWYETVVERE